MVTVDDVPGTPKQFATALFNRWGIGSAQTNNGVLVLLVMARHRLEIETGRGIEAALTSAWLADMQRDQMVPRFKASDFRGGLLTGIAAIDEHLRAAVGESATTAPAGEYRSNGDRVVMPPSADNAPAPLEAVSPSSVAMRSTDGGPGGLVAGGLGALGVLGIFGGSALAVRNRRRQRICTHCQPPREMVQLDERADDAHLDPGQRTEETIGSVDYVVLLCPGCQSSRTFRHGRWFSGYDTGAGCSYKTSKSSTTTLVAATYDYGGEIEVVESCAHCDRHNRYTRSTPQLTRPSSSSTSSSLFSDSSSSSSSSDSGFSGGSSSGGGAGSDW